MKCSTSSPRATRSTTYGSSSCTPEYSNRETTACNRCNRGCSTSSPGDHPRTPDCCAPTHSGRCCHVRDAEQHASAAPPALRSTPGPEPKPPPTSLLGCTTT